MPTKPPQQVIFTDSETWIQFTLALVTLRNAHQVKYTAELPEQSNLFQRAQWQVAVINRLLMKLGYLEQENGSFPTIPRGEVQIELENTEEIDIVIGTLRTRRAYCFEIWQTEHGALAQEAKKIADKFAELLNNLGVPLLDSAKAHLKLDLGFSSP